MIRGVIVMIAYIGGSVKMFGFPEYDRGLYYRDQQQARVFCFCPICGGEMYNPDDDICWYCQQKGGADDGDIAD